jgi:hypothetical protein
VVLPALATAADLAARNIVLPANMDAGVVLNSAMDSVRDAAGCPIAQTTSTVTLVAADASWLDLPAGPVSAVASIMASDGVTPITDWTKVGDSVRLQGDSWPPGTAFPVEIIVTYTHGLPIVPADIVDLVCQVAAIMGAQGGDPGTGGKTTAVRLGDFSETYSIPAGTESPSPVALPESVKNALRARFGVSASVVGMRR